jgi:hypothetical protein
MRFFPQSKVADYIKGSGKRKQGGPICHHALVSCEANHLRGHWKAKRWPILPPYSKA